MKTILLIILAIIAAVASANWRACEENEGVCRSGVRVACMRCEKACFDARWHDPKYGVTHGFCMLAQRCLKLTSECAYGSIGACANCVTACTEMAKFDTIAPVSLLRGQIRNCQEDLERMCLQAVPV